MAADERLTIFFDAKGDERLIKAINSLARAQGRLAKATSSTTRTNQRNSKSMERQKKGAMALGGTMSVLRSKLLVYAFAAQMVNKTLGAMIRLSMKQEDAEKRLAAQLGRTSKELLNHATNLQKVTAFGDEEVLAVQTQIAAYTKEEETIKRLTEATLDLAEGKGIDLATAGELVSKTYGSSTNALSRYGVTVSGAADSTRRLESLTKNIDALYGGMSTKIDTTSKALKQMTNALGDAGEEVGDAFLPITKRMAIAMTKFTHESLIPTINTIKKIDFGKTFENIMNNMQEVVKFVIGNLALWPKASVIIAGQMVMAFYNHFILPLSEAFTLLNMGGLLLELGKQFALGIGKLLGYVVNEGLRALHTGALKIVKGIADKMTKYMPRLADMFDLENLDKEMEKLMAPQFDFDWIDDKLTESAKKVGANPLFQYFKDTFDQDIYDMDSLMAAFSTNFEDTLGKLVAWQKETAESGSEATDKQKTFFETINEGMSELMGQVNWEGLTDALGFASDIFGQIADEAKASAQKQMDAIDAVANKEIQTLKNSRIYKHMTDKQKADYEKKILDKAEKDKKVAAKNANKALAKQFQIEKTMKIANALINTEEAATKALAQGGFFVGPAMAVLIRALGMASVAMIASQKPPKMAKGGLVGGKLHSQGGTMIEAEQGEFVMSRSAVGAMGVEAMNRINQGGGGGSVNISFLGNVLSDDFIAEEAVPKIKEALRRGGDIGVS